MEVRTPMCEGEIILDQEAVSTGGILKDSIRRLTVACANQGEGNETKSNNDPLTPKRGH